MPNFNPIEVVCCCSCCSKTQLQVDENLNKVTQMENNLICFVWLSAACCVV